MSKRKFEEVCEVPNILFYCDGLNPRNQQLVDSFTSEGRNFIVSTGDIDKSIDYDEAFIFSIDKYEHITRIRLTFLENLLKITEFVKLEKITNIIFARNGARAHSTFVSCITSECKSKGLKLKNMGMWKHITEGLPERSLKQFSRRMILFEKNMKILFDDQPVEKTKKIKFLPDETRKTISRKDYNDEKKEIERQIDIEINLNDNTFEYCDEDTESNSI